MKRSDRLSVIVLFLGGMILFSGCDDPGVVSCSFPPSSERVDLSDPELLNIRVTALGQYISNPIPGKAQNAIRALKRLGADAEPAIPTLEKVVNEYPDDKVKAAAREALKSIKEELSKDSSE